MSHHADADPGFFIPPPPRRPRPVATLRLPPGAALARPGWRGRLVALAVREASAVGILALLGSWGLAELALLLTGP